MYFVLGPAHSIRAHTCAHINIYVIHEYTDNRWKHTKRRRLLVNVCNWQTIKLWWTHCSEPSGEWANWCNGHRHSKCSFDSSILLCQRSEMQWRINYALCCFQESLIKSSAIDTKLISSQINLQIDQFYVRHRKLGRQRLFKQRYRSGGYECTFSMISGHQT